jgi:hypothetical protein
MTDDDAIAWVRFNRIQVVTKHTMTGNRQGWRFTIRRTGGQTKDSTQVGLTFMMPGSRKPGMAEVLQFISDNAWEKFLTRRTGALPDGIWGFFLQTELKELYELSRE